MKIVCELKEKYGILEVRSIKPDGGVFSSVTINSQGQYIKDLVKLELSVARYMASTGDRSLFVQDQESKTVSINVVDYSIWFPGNERFISVIMDVISNLQGLSPRKKGIELGVWLQNIKNTILEKKEEMAINSVLPDDPVELPEDDIEPSENIAPVDPIKEAIARAQKRKQMAKNKPGS